MRGARTQYGQDDLDVAVDEFGAPVVADLDVEADRLSDSLGRAQGAKSVMNREMTACSTSCLLVKWCYIVEDEMSTASAMSRMDVAPWPRSENNLLASSRICSCSTGPSSDFFLAMSPMVTEPGRMSID